MRKVTYLDIVQLLSEIAVHPALAPYGQVTRDAAEAMAKDVYAQVRGLQCESVLALKEAGLRSWTKFPSPAQVRQVVVQQMQVDPPARQAMGWSGSYHEPCAHCGTPCTAERPACRFLSCPDRATLGDHTHPVYTSPACRCALGGPQTTRRSVVAEPLPLEV